MSLYPQQIVVVADHRISIPFTASEALPERPTFIWILLKLWRRHFHVNNSMLNVKDNRNTMWIVFCARQKTKSHRLFFQTSECGSLCSVCHNTIKNVVEPSRNIWVTIRRGGPTHQSPSLFHFFYKYFLTLDQICRLYELHRE